MWVDGLPSDPRTKVNLEGFYPYEYRGLEEEASKFFEGSTYEKPLSFDALATQFFWDTPEYLQNAKKHHGQYAMAYIGIGMALEERRIGHRRIPGNDLDFYFENK